MTDLRARFESFAQQFTEKSQAARPQVPPILKEDYWRSVRDLFTRDVTPKGLSELVQHDAGETLRFFLREVDLEALRPLPWYKRYAQASWKLFLAMAYRLSPARRILFAVAVPMLLLGWLHSLFSFQRVGVWVFPPIQSWEGRQLIAGTLLFILLLLELRDKLSLKGDLEIARQIQFGLVPSGPFAKAGIQICASMRPANTVGGDYYDIIDRGGDEIVIAVGDVAGKGMPAALLMAMLQGSLRTLITAGFRGSDLIAKLNAHLLANGVALGILADARFETGELTLEPGDRVLLYTDGVTEAFDHRDREYGEDRLLAYLAKSRDLSQQALIDGLKEDVLAFCGPVRPRDDMTMMVVGRES